MWNPEVYLAFADQRGRPFVDLMARVGADTPRRVVDLGCGPGNLTVALAQRWPAAVIEAWDSSPEMVQAARERGVDARIGDVRDWTPAPDTDVVVSNATLHWVPEHAELLVRWASQLRPGAWIAMQVPGNFDAPSHRAVRELAERPPWSEPLRDMPFRDGKVVSSAVEYAGLLTDAGCAVDAWETTYVHELQGKHPVLEWITGTALTPVKSRLTDEQWQQFRRELIPLLDEAYPARPDGTTFFPFRRVFVVAQVGSPSRAASAR
ncbi:trans-aconitate 2-methyltransferase [Mycobacterium hubeiense]|uniref:trans-aconitate 2-methyltransferase n=1 Tax=Mycobacterium hubeiense TaxID=1867256 RepID=UPI000C7F6E62|nr:trans-aconitate 2-methyltransferase [Mycobacterium sp. QGD 101]